MTETTAMTPTSIVTAKRKTESLLYSRALQPMTSTSAAPSRGFAARASLVVKQILDYVIAGLLLVLSAPVILVVAVLIKLSSPGPVLFVQKRVGRNGRLFDFYKFRTMKHNSDDRVHREFSANFIRGSGGDGDGACLHADSQDGTLASDGSVYKLTQDPRITAIGRFLRRTSLDELPQLIHVLRGQMSLVGPRPPVVYELDHYQEWHKRRLQVKPGITGLWQVSGRSSVPFDEMVQLDLYYIDHRSTSMDLWIMARTVPVMIKGNGAY